MDYKYTDISTDNNIELKESDKIHPLLLKNNKNDILKAIDFLKSDGKFLYVHGFLGTGKRQFVNYLCSYLSNDVITLEYFCKEATVCDDILLSFISVLEQVSQSKTLNFNSKITTLTARFEKLILSIKKPILIILHTLDNINNENLSYITDLFSKLLKEQNIKIIITTCALKPGLMGDIEESKTIFIKAFTKDIFAEFIQSNNIKASDRQIEDFYALTRGYYFYTVLSVKIIQSQNITLAEFLQKIKNAESNFDNYIGELYISLVPVAIRNFFWFLRAIRHGLSLNALAVFEIYDEFSIQYLISNMLAFQKNEWIYLHDYFANKIDIMLPNNTEIKLHKYIIGLYEQMLKENISDRAVLISRQALRTEIDYHSQRINDIENGNNPSKKISSNNEESQTPPDNIQETPELNNSSIPAMIQAAKKLEEDDKFTESIEKFKTLLENNSLDLTTLIEIRLHLGRLYCKIGDYSNSTHYYELVETYYKNNKEYINLNYLYYEMTDLYYKMYKLDRAIETIKKVIYSVDTPQSLMVSSCTLLGNIYSDMNNPENAFSYYQKALDSLDENVENSILAELYFKFALANDDKGDSNLAFEYYNRCISITEGNKYLALAYSNLASCYSENGNLDDAINCFMKAYEIEKAHNNYDGIYYTSSHIAKIMLENGDKNAFKYLMEAKQSAEFVNEAFYIVESSIALGDYYYNIPSKSTEALTEYCKAKKVAVNSSEEIDITNINKRISDMSLRMSKQDFTEILTKYGR